MDILLVAVSLYTEKDPTALFTTSRGGVEQVEDPAYADDFLTMSSSQAGLQRKADIFSAGAILLRLQLVPIKLRSGAITLDGRGPLFMDIHTKNWEKDKIELAQEGAIKYLGSTQALNGQSKDEMKLIMEFLESTIHRLQSRSGSAEVHYRYLHGATAAKIGYQGSFANDLNWKPINTKLGKHMKTKLKLQQSFPGEVLFGSAASGGCGIENLEDSTQELKLRAIKQMQGSDRISRATMDGILDRQHRRQGGSEDSNSRILPSGDQHWIGSVTRYLGEGNLTLTQARQLESNELDRILNSGRRAADHADNTATGHIIRPLTEAATGYEYSNEKVLLFSKGTLIQHGEDAAFEILGWNDNEAIGFIWRSQHSIRRSRGNKRIQLVRENSVSTVTRASLEEATQRLVGDKVRDGSRISMSATMLEGGGRFRRQLVAEALEASWELPYLDPTGEYIIATDGSWTENKSGPFSEQSAPSTGTAVVLVQKGRSEAIWGIQVPNMYTTSTARAFSQELVATVLGTWLSNRLHSNIPIYSDCKAVVDLGRKFKTKQGHSHGALFNLLDQWDTRNLHWVASHTDSKGGPSSYIEEGNILADRAADCKPMLHIEPLSAATIHNALIQHSTGWVICDNNGITVEPTRDIVTKRRMTRYLADREVEKDRGVQWHMDTLKMALGESKTMAQKGALIRLFLARFWRDIQAFTRSEDVPWQACDCGCDNTLMEWTGECTEDETANIRVTATDKVRRTLADEPLLREVIIELMQGTGREQIWRGNWQPIHKEIIVAAGNSGPARMREERWTKWALLVSHVTKICTTASLDMQTLRKPKKIVKILPTPTDTTGWYGHKKRTKQPWGTKKKKHAKAKASEGTAKMYSYFKRVTRQLKQHRKQKVSSTPLNNISLSTSLEQAGFTRKTIKSKRLIEKEERLATIAKRKEYDDACKSRDNKQRRNQEAIAAENKRVSLAKQRRREDLELLASTVGQAETYTGQKALKSMGRTKTDDNGKKARTSIRATTVDNGYEDTEMGQEIRLPPENPGYDEFD